MNYQAAVDITPTGAMPVGQASTGKDGVIHLHLVTLPVHQSRWNGVVSLLPDENNPQVVWHVCQRAELERLTVVFASLKLAKEFVEERTKGIWNESNAHGEIHYLLPPGSVGKAAQRDQWLWYIIPQEVRV